MTKSFASRVNIEGECEREAEGSEQTAWAYIKTSRLDLAESGASWITVDNWSAPIKSLL